MADKPNEAIVVSKAESAYTNKLTQLVAGTCKTATTCLYNWLVFV